MKKRLKLYTRLEQISQYHIKIACAEYQNVAKVYHDIEIKNSRWAKESKNAEKSREWILMSNMLLAIRSTEPKMMSLQSELEGLHTNVVNSAYDTKVWEIMIKKYNKDKKKKEMQLQIYR